MSRQQYTVTRLPPIDEAPPLQETHNVSEKRKRASMNGANEPPPPGSEDDYGTAPQEQFDFARVPLTVEQWCARDLPEPDFISGLWLTTSSRALLVADTGLGKTNFAIALGMAAAAGKPFAHWAGQRKIKVAFIDGEMSRRLLKKRIEDEADRLGVRPDTFFAISHEDIPNFAPLNTSAGQACIEALIQHLGGVDLIIFDSVMCLLSGDMKDEEPWQQTLPWIRSLTARSIGQLWVHHTGHDKTRSYGTKTREWQLDTVIVLEAAERPDTDLSFSLTFTKAREREPATRADFQPVTIWLADNRWNWRSDSANTKKRVSDLNFKFLGALRDATAGSSLRVVGRPAATLTEWRAECTKHGLIDPDEKPDSARSLFSKARRELIAADQIAANETAAWVL